MRRTIPILPVVFTLICASVQAEVPLRSPEELKSDSTHIVVGNEHVDKLVQVAGIVQQPIRKTWVLGIQALQYVGKRVAFHLHGGCSAGKWAQCGGDSYGNGHTPNAIWAIEIWD